MIAALLGRIVRTALYRSFAHALRGIAQPQGTVSSTASRSLHPEVALSLCQAFPTLGNFQEWLRQQARDFGHVTTAGGRKRLLPHINSSNPSDRARAERQAVNSVIQASVMHCCNQTALCDYYVITM